MFSSGGPQTTFYDPLWIEIKTNGYLIGVNESLNHDYCHVLLWNQVSYKIISS